MEWLYPAVSACGMAALARGPMDDVGRTNMGPVFQGALQTKDPARLTASRVSIAISGSYGFRSICKAPD